VAKAGFIEVNRGNGKGRAQESSTWKCSRSSSTKVISSPVIDRYPDNASRPRLVPSDEATTTYSLPRRRSTTRLRCRTACSSCSIRVGLHLKRVKSLLPLGGGLLRGALLRRSLLRRALLRRGLLRRALLRRALLRRA